MLRRSSYNRRFLSYLFSMDGVFTGLNCRSKSKFPSKFIVEKSERSQQNSALISSGRFDDGKSRNNTRTKFQYASKGRQIQIQVNQELRENVLKDVDEDFERICEKIKQNFAVNPVILIYLPNVFVTRRKIDEFLDDYFQKWWTMLQPKLNGLSSSVVSDLFFDLWKINKHTNGKFLTNFGSSNVLKLAEITLKDVDFMHANKMETFLKVLRSTFSDAETDWLNERLIIAVEKWILMQNSANDLGILLELLSQMNVCRPSEDCLRFVINLCFEQFDNCPKSLPNENKNRTVYNCLGFANSFNFWNYNPNLSRNNFWLRWYKIVNDMRPGADEKLQSSINFTTFMTMLKFDCMNEFETHIQSWSASLKQTISFVPFNQIQIMVRQAETKFAQKPELLAKYLRRDVLNMLENRFQLASSMNAIDEEYKDEEIEEKKKMFDGDIFYGLCKINKNTNGLYLNTLEWPRIRKLVDYTFNDVTSLNSHQLYHVLKLLESRIYLSGKGIPQAWLDKILTDFIERWISANFQTLISCADSRRRIGGIMTCLTKLDVRPSKECLELITKICIKEMNLNEKIASSSRNVRFFNLLNIGEAFLNWKIDPETYSKNFWPSWYKEMSTVQKQFDKVSSNITANLHRDYLLIALKFDREKEFGRIKNDFTNFLTKNSKHFTPESARSMLLEADKKYKDKSERILSKDTSNLLEKRLYPLIAENFAYWSVWLIFMLKYAFCYYLIYQLHT